MLARGLSHIDNDVLEEFPEFQEFKVRTRPLRDPAAAAEVPSAVAPGVEPTLTPDERIRNGNRALRANLASEVLERVLKASPGFFESLVVDLLVAMGYGGTQEDAASVVGRSGDGGIDGIIKQDRLGLENIYIQAKRWDRDRTVGRPEIHQFAGALQGQRARKGVFITTARFSQEALRFADGVQTTIILIDGQQLSQLMLDFGVGVSVQETIRLLKVDEDYFEEDA